MATKVKIKTLGKYQKKRICCHSVQRSTSISKTTNAIFGFKGNLGECNAFKPVETVMSKVQVSPVVAHKLQCTKCTKQNSFGNVTRITPLNVSVKNYPPLKTFPFLWYRKFARINVTSNGNLIY